MEERINKPRVFLSHSKKNSEFIEKLASDLRKCQIEPWLDTDQIHHGKSWQDSIFELGLPTCDAIIVYFTELSIQSAVVKKEMDVGLLQNLKDSNIAFLPYVSNEKLRSELRPDIQALQVPEWNDNNYLSLLPRVVAEIWRSFLERTVSNATQGERIKRIEAELELAKYKNQPESVFSLSENKEFEYIWNSFDREYFFGATSTNFDGEEYITAEHRFSLQLSTIFFLLNDLFTVDYTERVMHKNLNQHALALVDNSKTYQSRFDHDIDQSITGELLTHGLIEKISITINQYGSESIDTIFQFTNKYFRFRYWLAYSQKMPNHILLEIIQ